MTGQCFQSEYSILLDERLCTTETQWLGATCAVYTTIIPKLVARIILGNTAELLRCINICFNECIDYSIKKNEGKKSALYFQLVCDKLVSNHKCFKICLIHSICIMYILKENCWLYFAPLDLPLFGLLLNSLFMMQFFSRINTSDKSFFFFLLRKENKDRIFYSLERLLTFVNLIKCLNVLGFLTLHI